MFQLDTLPQVTFEATRRARGISGERRLQAAVLYRALEDLEKYARRRDAASREITDDVWRWLRLDGDGPHAFVTICEAFHLAHSRVRAHLLGIYG